MASEPRDRSAPAKRRARARVGESEGRSPSDKTRAGATEHLSRRIRRVQNCLDRSTRTIPGRLSDRANQPPRAQTSGAGGHEHLTEVACVDVPPGEKRPEFGCFNVGTVTGLISVKHPSTGTCARFPAGRLRTRPGVRPESWWRKTGGCGSPNSVPETVPRGEAKLSPSSDHCSFPQQRVTLRCSLTLSCGPATVRGCIRTRARRLVRAGGRAVPGDSGWRQQGSGRRNDDGASGYSNGTKRHWYDAPACVRPGHP